jgi:Uracil DNA glycosylase superfamily
MIISILVEKYGKEIIANLSKSGRINRDNEAPKGTERDVVEAQMQKMIELGLLTQSDYEQGKPWAFDVSSTYADLTQTKKIPIMIIGEDPHVDDKDYQAVYGFAQKGTMFEKSQITGKFKKYLLKLFFSEQEINRLSNDEMHEFLAKFYVTDLCHFTPQGRNNRKDEVQNWKIIKENTAKYFIKREIEAISPDYIITHGGVSRRYLSKILGFKMYETGKIGHKHFSGDFNGITVIGISHLGSGETTGHWNKNIDEMREFFMKKSIKIV